MILYKMVDRFDPKTGKKLLPQPEEYGVICDFTGKCVEYAEELGPTYTLQYNSLDSCGGCGEGENEFMNKWKVEINYFLFGSPYIFDENNIDIETIISQYKAEGLTFSTFDQLFRWCRIRTADKLLSESIYTLDELGIERAD